VRRALSLTAPSALALAWAAGAACAPEPRGGAEPRELPPGGTLSAEALGGRSFEPVPGLVPRGFGPPLAATAAAASAGGDSAPPIRLAAALDLDPFETAIAAGLVRPFASAARDEPDPTLAPFAPVLHDAEPAMDIGDELEDRLGQFPQGQVNQNGVALLTAEELFGDPNLGEEMGLCLPPEYIASFEHEGDAWEARFVTANYTLFTAPTVAVLTELPAACENALQDAGGDVDAAIASGGCSIDVEPEFFPEGGECRACVGANGGDFDACVESAACEANPVDQAWFDTASGPRFFSILGTYIWACAPVWTSLSLLMADLGPDGAPPALWEHERWGPMCNFFWDESSESVLAYCIGGILDDEVHGAVGGGVPGSALWFRREDSDEDLWEERRTVFSAVELPGATIRTHSAWNPGITPLSLRDGYGLRPTDLRPDGETLARDYIAGIALKWSTRHNGLIISYYNHNRCAPDGWGPAAADGSRRRDTLLPPVLGWQDDADTYSADESGNEPLFLPMATLGSSGLPDPDAPGGLFVDVAGTPALANPDYDGCSYPRTWIPDRVRVPDADDPPDDNRRSLDAHTYRFGREDFDFRIVFHTNTRRDFCPGDGD
jgi:hypothetical protein